MLPAEIWQDGELRVAWRLSLLAWIIYNTCESLSCDILPTLHCSLAELQALPRAVCAQSCQITLRIALVDA